MLSIVNERGIPGTVGAVLTGRDGRRRFLSCHHVLYGGGARDGGRVWAVHEGRAGRSYVEIGMTGGGGLGRVGHRGRVVFVDYAVGIMHDEARLPDPMRRGLDACAPLDQAAEPTTGQRVRKHGRITGRTAGVIADTAHFERPYLDGREHEAPGQLLIRPEHPDHCFSAPGESGAAVLDDEGRIVGVLWGANADGAGIAFPAGAALDHLRLVPAENLPRPAENLPRKDRR